MWPRRWRWPPATKPRWRCTPGTCWRGGRRVALEVIHTPGHSPGSVSLYCEQLEVVFSGDALTADGPAPHAGEYPDFPGQLSAIGQELLTLPEETRVLPGHGE